MTSCRKIFAPAELHSIKTLRGSTVKLSIAAAAAAHLGAAVPNLDPPIYTAGPLDYQEQAVQERVRYEAGHLIVPDGPGLGMELDEGRLDAKRL